MTRTIVAVALTAGLLASCTNAAVSKVVGAGQDGADAVVVRSTDTAIIVENHAGRPLLNVRIAVTATGAASPFIAIVPTIDTGATSEQALTGFRSDEAIVFDPAAVRPTEVHVTARDMLSKTYDVTVPWGRP